MRTVLVTGGAGFIGSHLVEQLLDGGGVVRVLDNLATGSLANLSGAAARHSRGNGAPRDSRFEVVVGDVRDRGTLRKAMRGVKYVFHLAALPEIEASIESSADIHTVNVEGTLNVLQSALTEGVWRVVFASCGSAYGRPDQLPVSEEAPLRPATLFAASKVAAETYCRAFYARHQLDTVALRYFTVYGARQRPGSRGLMPRLIEAVQLGGVLGGFDDRTVMDLLHVDDGVAAMLAAGRAPRAAGRVINVGSGQMVTIGDVVNTLGSLLKARGVPSVFRAGDGTPERICAETTLASELLDFTPRVSLTDGLARVVRALEESEDPDRTLAPVGLDD
jgi:UDP-glucose 4-epimerase